MRTSNCSVLVLVAKKSPLDIFARMNTTKNVVEIENDWNAERIQIKIPAISASL